MTRITSWDEVPGKRVVNIVDVGSPNKLRINFEFSFLEIRSIYGEISIDIYSGDIYSDAFEPGADLRVERDSLSGKTITKARVSYVEAGYQMNDPIIFTLDYREDVYIFPEDGVSAIEIALK